MYCNGDQMGISYKQTDLSEKTQIISQSYSAVHLFEGKSDPMLYKKALRNFQGELVRQFAVSRRTRRRRRIRKEHGSKCGGALGVVILFMGKLATTQ